MWALIPFALQAALIGFDEFYFHHKRGLPVWERIGHPIDTLSVLACFLFVLFVPFSDGALNAYIALSVFSTILITKDEFVHKHCCPWKEHWLHAVLFTLHPVVLATAGFMWPVSQGMAIASWASRLFDNPELLAMALHVQCAALALFFLYQLIYWNIFYDQQRVL